MLAEKYNIAKFSISAETQSHKATATNKDCYFKMAFKMGALLKGLGMGDKTLKDKKKVHI